MRSQRLNWQTQENPLAQLARQYRQQGMKILNLAESNPTRAHFARPSDVVLQALAAPASMSYEPDPQGILPAREAVCANYANAGVNLSPDRLFLTASTSEAYSFLFKLLCNPGDHVLVPRPGYPLFDYLAALDSVALRPYRLEYSHPAGWQLDFDSLEAACTAGTRAIIVIHPNNPTGSYIRAQERARLISFCLEKGLALIADEVFLDYSLVETADARSFLHESEIPVFVLNGFSKLLGMPQMKLAWLAYNGPAEAAAELLPALEIIADTFLSCSAPVLNATPAWLSILPALQHPILSRVRANYAWLLTRLADTPFRVLTTQGGWTALIEAPRLMHEDAWAMGLLKEEHLMTYPGYFFDCEREAFLSVSLLLQPTELAEGINRLLAFTSRHSL